MIIFLLGSHIYLTIKTGFVQKYIFKGIKRSFRRKAGEKGDLSVFGSLMTALSSTVGTGNIVGVGTAIVAGGPGAVFWTWIGGILGIATKYAETYIATKHRKRLDDGTYIGGAMTALQDLNKPLLSKAFCWFCALAAFGIGCSSQSASINDVITSNINVSSLLIGIVIAILVAMVVFGGIKIIAKVCELLVPIMSLAYIIGCIYVLFVNREYMMETVSLIFSSAFTTRAVTGGFTGTTIIMAMRAGISRGLFSNEAGMGSAPIASAVSNSENAVEPSLVGSTGVFWDTVVICLLSGLVIVSCIVGNPSIIAIDIDGGALVSKCFSTIPVVGTPLLVFGILTFSFSTILGWSYYGETCIRFLFKKSDRLIFLYRILWEVVLIIGCVSNFKTVWALADVFNASMCIPNIIAVFYLKNEIAKDTKYYLSKNRLDETDHQMQ